MTEISLSDVVSGSGEGPRRRSQRAAAKRRKQRRRRTWVSVLVVLLVLSGGAYAAYAGLRPLIASFQEPDDYTGEGTGAVTVTVPEGATGSAIGSILKSAGVVKSGKAFVRALGANPAGATIQPGTYRLRQKMASASAVTALLAPKNRLVTRVTLREGLRLSQILDLVAKQTKIPRSQLAKAAKDAEGIGLPASAKGNAEGYLFPATYDVQPGTTARKLLGDMVGRTEAALREAGVPAAREHEILTLASIVQVEAGSVEDMGKVARVFRNRLAKVDRGIGTLNSDATVSYATNSFAITTTPQQRRSPSPYNTYLKPGLPPGPISSPGLEAMKAALSPTPGPWVYFVTVDPDTGETRFSTTLAQHEEAVKIFQAWLRKHPGRG